MAEAQTRSWFALPLESSFHGKMVSASHHSPERMLSSPALSPDVAMLLETLPLSDRDLVASVRGLVLATLPKVIETADRQARVIGYGYGPRYRDTVSVIILSKTGVKLGLPWGAGLPDPHQLLAGKGKVHRHIAFTEESQVERPAAKALLRAALSAWKERAAGVAR